MATVNEEFFDALVRHQVFLLRLSQGMQKSIERILDETEADIVSQIARRAKRFPDGPTTQNFIRLRLLERSIRTTRLRAWDEVTDLWVKEMRELAKTEPAFVQGLLHTVAPVVLDTILPGSPLLEALVNARPYQGKVLKDWAKGVAQTDLDRILGSVRIGMVQGESASQISRRIVGTTRTSGRNGLTEITRRNANAITRTIINGVANSARDAFFVANTDLFSEEVYVATLDSRTTPVCRANDGKRFPVGKGPKPPLHFSCRSLRVAVINGKVIGDRPLKAVTERQLLREYAKKNGFGTPSGRSGLPYGHKGSFDEFARRRVREMTGTVPAEVNFQQWLTRQPRPFIDDTLGPTRSKLFREGKLQLDKFVNRQGDELNLKQLAQRHKEAFRSAGLDPEDFL